MSVVPHHGEKIIEQQEEIQDQDQDDSKVILPTIRTLKRRIIANDNRRRALFSCDRCKVKKIACQRVSTDGLQHDSKTPCVQCKKLDLDCKTTIQRKKRVHGPIENIGLHYKCLITILKGLYPERDVNSIDSLIELGDSLNLKMPSRDGTSATEEEELKNIAILLTSSKKKRRQNSNSPIISESVPPSIIKKEEDHSPEAHTIITTTTTTSKPASQNNGQSLSSIKHNRKQEDERVIVDQGGNVHYIGPLGAPAMASTLLTLFVRHSNGNQNAMAITRLQRENPNRENIINSKQRPWSPELFRLIDLENYPLIMNNGGLSRKEADYYVNVFFDQIHPLVYCFDKAAFMQKYSIFWTMMYHHQNNNNSNNNTSPIDGGGTGTTPTPDPINKKKFKLSNAQVCSVYIVWILARTASPYSNGHTQNTTTSAKMQLDDSLMNRYMDVIKLTMSEILLTPTVDGIRCMLLLSIYMDNNKRRESGYSLIEAAARQAVSIGLNRNSLSKHMELDSTKTEELKRLWWVIFKNELRFSNQMGRSSCLQLEDINIDNPNIPDDSFFQDYTNNEIQLNKIMYGLLQYRKKLFMNNELLSLINMEKAINLKKQFNNWFDNLPESLASYEMNPRRFKAHLHLQYHYYFITLSLPFLIYFAIHRHNLKLSKDDPILDMICQCVKSSIAISNAIAFIDNHGFFNGTIQIDLFCCYHATMALALFYLMLNKTAVFDMAYIGDRYGISSDNVTQSLQLIRYINFKNTGNIKGSLATISELIEVLSSDAEFLVKLYTVEEEEQQYHKQAQETQDKPTSTPTSTSQIPRPMFNNNNKSFTTNDLSSREAGLADDGITASLTQANTPHIVVQDIQSHSHSEQQAQPQAVPQNHHHQQHIVNPTQQDAVMHQTNTDTNNQSMPNGFYPAVSPGLHHQPHQPHSGIPPNHDFSHALHNHNNETAGSELRHQHQQQQSGLNVFDMNTFGFSADNQMILDNDMIDLLFGNDLFGLYNDRSQNHNHNQQSHHH